MYFRIFVLLTFCLICVTAKSQWTQVFTNNTAVDNVYSLSVGNDSGVIAVRAYDYLYSVNSGTNWNINPIANFGCGSTWSLKSVGYHNKDTFCVTGGYNSSNYFGNVTSLNGGTSFNCYNSTVATSNQGFNKAYIGRSGRVFIFTNKGHLFTSPDYGVSFTKIQDVSNGVASSFINDSLGILIKNSDFYYYNHSTGVLDDYSIPLGTTALDGQLINDTVAYLVTNNTTGRNLYRTTNKGQSWQKIFLTDLSLLNEISKVKFLNADTGFVYGNKILLRTLDGGNSWQVKRFNSFTLQELYFTDLNYGFIGGVMGNATFIYRTLTGGDWEDFSYFYMSNAVCCANVVCGLNATFTPGNSYNWLLDGNPAGSGISPGSISMSSGTHSVSLISTNGSEVDTFTQNIYSAPPLPSGTTITGNPDSTICYGTIFTFGATSSNTNYEYSMYEGSTLMDGPVNGNGVTRYLYSDPLFDTAIITVSFQTQYYYCPGNTISRNINVVVYPNAANELPLALDDSVCPGDSAVITIPNTISPYQYILTSIGYTNCYPVNVSSVGNNQDMDISVQLAYDDACTKYFYYTVLDTYGCSNTSGKTKVLVDSVHARLYSQDFFGEIGDTVHINNQSEGSILSWDFNNQFLDLLASNNISTEFKIIDQGNSKIELNVTNQTGCKDSIYQFINGYSQWNDLNNNYCFGFVTEDSISTVYPEIGCKSFHNYSRVLHVDKNGNYYSAGLSDVASNNNFNSSTINKYDEFGNLIWKQKFAFFGSGLSDKTVFISSIASDSLGNCYITGKYNNGFFQVDNIIAPNISTYYAPGMGFIAKITKTGNVQWIDFINYYQNPPNHQFSEAFNVKVLNNNSIIFNTDIIKGIYRMPGGNNIWNSTPPDEDGFIIIDSTGNVTRHIAFNNFKENLLENLNTCASNSATLFPYGKDYEVADGKIYVLSLHKFYTTYLFNGNYYYRTPASGTGEGIGIVSVFDMCGNSIRDFEAFRFTRFDSLYDATDYFYYSNADWLQGNINMAEPKIAVDGHSNIHVTFTPYASKIYSLFNDSIAKSRYMMITPQTGRISSSYRGAIVQKFDSVGNPIFTFLNNGMIIKDISISSGGKLNCLADYTSYYSIQSADSTFFGHENSGSNINGVYFSYNADGTIQNIDNINSTGIVNTAAITTMDTCNSNVYFSFVSNDISQYESQNLTTDYIYHILKVNNELNCGDAGSCSWIYEDCSPSTIGEDEVGSFSTWYLMPNPATDRITLIGREDLVGSIKVYSSLGQEIFSDNAKKMSGSYIDISKYSNGLYYIFLLDETGMLYGRLSFIKQ